MKKSFIAIAMVCVSFFAFAQKTGNKVQFNSVDMNGKTVTSEIFSKNKLTMINVWGTFCPPCIREMPDLAKLSRENKSKGIEIIGIPIDIVEQNWAVIDSSKKDGNEIIKTTGADYVHVVPSKDMMNGFLKNVQVVPYTIFVDKDGNQVGNPYFGSRSKKDWQKIMDDLLASQN